MTAGLFPVPCDPASVVQRLAWLLADGSVNDEDPLTAAALRNVLVGRQLDDPAGGRP